VLHAVPELRIGETIGQGEPFGRPAPEFAPPTLQTVVRPKDPSRRGDLSDALQDLAAADPLIDVHHGVITLTACAYDSAGTSARDFRALVVPLVLMTALKEAGTSGFEPLSAVELDLPASALSAVLPRCSPREHG
jgi:hypothetical protein